MEREVTPEFIEDYFGKNGGSTAFANFCNAVVFSTAHGSTLPTLSEKPGPDGGIDGEWATPDPAPLGFESPYLLPGLNIFQYKAKSISGRGRESACSSLIISLSGALKELQARLLGGKSCSRYVLFTNLQLGLETRTKTKGGAELHRDRTKVVKAIRLRSRSKADILIIDAAQLAAAVNSNPGLRITYFSKQVARCWMDAWDRGKKLKPYARWAQLVGRDSQIKTLRGWLQEEEAKVIIIHGPSGIGKTRLALEATEPYRLTTTAIEDLNQIFAEDLGTLGTQLNPRILLVEDPSAEEAKKLVERAIAVDGVKVIITLPTDSRTPLPMLVDHPSIRRLARLAPLTRDAAAALLEAAGASFDQRALDWVLLQAGGNPEILLTAADLQSKGMLRQRSGDLKQGLHSRFCENIRAVLQEDGIRALTVLCPLLSVAVEGNSNDLDLLCRYLELGIDSSRVLELLPELVRTGYLRRRGVWASVVPPLFAASLIENLFSTHGARLAMLFGALDSSGRERFLERLVTAELPCEHPFWDTVFNHTQLAEQASQSFLLPGWIHALARATPNRTARFIAARVEQLKWGSWGDGRLTAILRELIQYSESCVTAMRCLEALTLRELENTGLVREPNLFCECFVHWVPEFPVPHAERAQWVRQLAKSTDRAHQSLAARIISFVTSPPAYLMGYPMAARRLGTSPENPTGSEACCYLQRLINLRLELSRTGDPAVSSIARDGLEGAIGRLMSHVPTDAWLEMVEQLVKWTLSDAITLDVTKLRDVVHWAQEGCASRKHQSNLPEVIQHWEHVGERLRALSETFDRSDFLTRLKIATGCTLQGLSLEAGNVAAESNQQSLVSLVAEIRANPDLMTEDAWAIVRRVDTPHVAKFYHVLGREDSQRRFLASIQQEPDDPHGDRRFGHYCQGYHISDGYACEAFLLSLTRVSSFPKRRVLWPILLIGPTPQNRRLLLLILRSKKVAPTEVARLFAHGSWLAQLPNEELLVFLRFVGARVCDLNNITAALSSYVYGSRPLPRKAFPLALKAIHDSNVSELETFQCNVVARSLAQVDLDKGFRTLERQFAVLNRRRATESPGPWNPLHSRGGNEFWSYLRTRDPHRAYRVLLESVGQRRSIVAEEPHVDWIDLQNHRQLFAKLIKDKSAAGEQIALLVSITQAGFFPFVGELLECLGTDSEFPTRFGTELVSRLEQGGFLTERQQASHAAVLEALKSSSLSRDLRKWLLKLATDIQHAIDSSPWLKIDQLPLGWGES